MRSIRLGIASLLLGVVVVGWPSRARAHGGDAHHSLVRRTIEAVGMERPEFVDWVRDIALDSPVAGEQACATVSAECPLNERDYAVWSVRNRDFGLPPLASWNTRSTIEDPPDVISLIAEETVAVDAYKDNPMQFSGDGWCEFLSEFVPSWILDMECPFYTQAGHVTAGENHFVPGLRHNRFFLDPEDPEFIPTTAWDRTITNSALTGFPLDFAPDYETNDYLATLYEYFGVELDRVGMTVLWYMSHPVEHNVFLDSDLGGGTDLGAESIDQWFADSADIAGHWSSIYTRGSDVGQGYGELAYLMLSSQGMVRTLGPMIHIAQDATIPQHAKGTSGNFHRFFESVMNHLLRSAGRGELMEDIGQSDLCTAAPRRTTANCLAALAGVALRRARAVSLPLDPPPAPGTIYYLDRLYGRPDRLAHRLQWMELIDAVAQQALDDYQIVVDEISGFLAERSLARCGAVPPLERFDHPPVQWCTTPTGARDGCVGCTAAGGYVVSLLGSSVDSLVDESEKLLKTYYTVESADEERLAALYDAELRTVDNAAAATLAALLLARGAGLTAEEWVATFDRDEDWIPDVVDNCPYRRNPDQANRDFDTLGDGCDPCPDTGAGGRPDGSDRDGDTIGDACDWCPDAAWCDPLTGVPYPGRRQEQDRRDMNLGGDIDFDGVGDHCDNCVLPPGRAGRPGLPESNPDQANCDFYFEVKYDLQPLGDACDPEPCTGMAPPLDGLSAVHLQGAAYPTDADLEPDPTTGVPRLPQPIVPIDPVVCAGGAGGEFCHVYEVANVDIPASGYIPAATPTGDGLAADLPVMVRRCVCWDYLANRVMPPERCHVDAACPKSGSVTWLPDQHAGWLAAKVKLGDGPVLNRYPLLEDSPGWLDMEEPVDPVGFDRAYAWAAPEVESVEWHWQDEVLPVDFPADTNPYFSVWTRPDLRNVRVDDPADPRRTQPASNVWPLVAKDAAGCRAQLGSEDACDDYDNAYALVPVEREPARWEWSHPTWLEAIMEASVSRWHFPITDWDIPSAPPASPSGGTSAGHELLGLRVVGPGDAIGPSDGRFPGYDPTSPVQGLVFTPVKYPFGLVGGQKIVSEMAPNESPINVTDFALLAVPPRAMSNVDLANTGGARVNVLYLFGGFDPSGHHSNRLWKGVRTTPVNMPENVVWTEIRPTLPSYQPQPLKDANGQVVYPERQTLGLVPPGLVGATLALDASAERLFVVGGTTETGYNKNVWVLEFRTGLWQRLPPRDEVMGPRADAGRTFRDGALYLYGGWDGSTPLSGLFRMNLASLALERLDVQSPPGADPGPRAAPSLQLTKDGTRLLLYGGRTANGSTNDLWSFDLRTGSWTALAAACSRGACPPLATAAMTFDESRNLLVLASGGPGSRQDAYWAWNGATWSAASDVVGSPAALDCDGDGRMDDGAHQACRIATGWWATVGRKECSRIAEAVECDAAETPVRQVTVLEQVKDGRLVADALGAVYALKQRHLRVFDATDANHPRQTANIRLDGEGRDVLLHKEVLYVATERGIEAYDRSDRLNPRRAWSWTVVGGVDDVVAYGRRIVLVERDGLRVVDVGDPTYPMEIAYHRLVNVLSVFWLLDPPSRIRNWCMPASPRRAASFDGQRLVVVQGNGIVSISLDQLAGAVIEGMGLLPREAATVKIEGEWIYTASPVGDMGMVVQRYGFLLVPVATHTLDSWVDVATYVDSRAYRPAPRGIEIAWY